MFAVKAWAVAAISSLAMGGVSAQLSATANPPPAEAFYRRADVTRAELSPSGRWLAMLSTVSGERSKLVVFDVLGDSKPSVAAAFSDLDIYSFTWVNDERLVFNTLDYQLGGGEQRWQPGLFSVHRDGTEVRLLIAIDVVETTVGTGPQPLDWTHRLLHVPRDGSDEVIVAEDRRDGTGRPLGIAPKRLNVKTGRASKMMVGQPAHVTRWWFDHRGEARMVETRQADRESLYWRKAGDSGWDLLDDHEIYQAPFTAHSIDAAGNLYVLEPRGPERADVLTRFDFSTRRPASEPLARTPGFDFQGDLVTETPGGRALGVRVLTDAESTVWFEPRLQALQKQADERLPGRSNRLTCKRCDDPNGMVVLVKSVSDRDPGEYLVYRADKQQWRSIVRIRSAIDPRRMGLRDFHRIKARDGLEFPVWVTTPPGPPTPRPTVVLVHDGPWQRGGDWAWNDNAQFLASRGYLVIEPEFRGSTGYGDALFKAGMRQWGLAMQDDVADALLWAVSKGYADGKRACIAGGGYGGYAALMGLVRHPDLYRCGIAWTALTDPRTMFDWKTSAFGEENRRYDLPTLIGDPVKDAARLADSAPVTHAAQIKAPLLLVAAGHDVNLDPMMLMRRRLTAAGQPPTWAMYDFEGPTSVRTESRAAFARQVEGFLADHLK